MNANLLSGWGVIYQKKIWKITLKTFFTSFSRCSHKSSFYWHQLAAMPAHMTQQSFLSFLFYFYFGSNTKTLFTRFVALRFFCPFVLHSLGWRRRKDFSLFLLSRALRCSDTNNLSHFSLNKDASPSRSREPSPIVHKFHGNCLNVHFDFGKEKHCLNNRKYFFEDNESKDSAFGNVLAMTDFRRMSSDKWMKILSENVLSLFIESHLQLFSTRF